MRLIVRALILVGVVGAVLSASGCPLALCLYCCAGTNPPQTAFDAHAHPAELPPIMLPTTMPRVVTATTPASVRY